MLDLPLFDNQIMITILFEYNIWLATKMVINATLPKIVLIIQYESL